MVDLGGKPQLFWLEYDGLCRPITLSVEGRCPSGLQCAHGAGKPRLGLGPKLRPPGLVRKFKDEINQDP